MIKDKNDVNDVVPESSMLTLNTDFAHCCGTSTVNFKQINVKS